MINLLPPDRANAIRFGRQNTILRKWLIGIAAAIAGLAIILAGGWVYIGQQSKTLKRNIAVTNDQLQSQHLDQVQKDAKEITGDINVINKVLSQEVRFSELVKSIGGDMPPGTVLSSLSLSNKVSGAIDLSANAKDYSSAALIAVNLGDPKNELFSQTKFLSVPTGRSGS
jgi:Tfp pilus assembly protein PilN